MGAAASRADLELCHPNSSQLTAKYTGLAAQLHVRGFDATAIAASARNFDQGQPRQYASPPWRLPPDAIRVIALPLGDETCTDTQTRRLARDTLRAARDVASILPSGSKFWLPELEHLHATVFHPGLSPQFDTQGRMCSLPLPLPPAGCWQRAPLGAGSPNDTELRQELRRARQIAASVPGSLNLVVDRVTMTSSGVMLLLLRPRSPDVRACVATLRAAAASAFPYAARVQTSGLVHVSLLRVLSLPAEEYGSNTSAAALAIVEATRRWSQRLRGEPVHVRGLLYVRERQIMTLEGETHRLRFGVGDGH